MQVNIEDHKAKVTRRIKSEDQGERNAFKVRFICHKVFIDSYSMSMVVQGP